MANIPSDLSDNCDRYSFIQADINDIECIEVIKDCDVIVNAAAETHVDRSIKDPKKFVHSNYDGTLSMLEYARKKDIIKYIQVSTDEVYGETVTGSSKETDILNPGNPYSATKAAADLLVMSYTRTYGLKASITRCTNNFGSQQNPEKLIPKTIIRTLHNLPVYLYGDGSQIRDWIYVVDHVKAIEQVIKKGRNGVYNISTSNHITNLSLVNQISALLENEIGKPVEIRFSEDRPGHDYRYSLDSSKINNEFGWLPKTPFAEALGYTVKWYLKNKTWWKGLTEYAGAGRNFLTS
jgi:dTDP-glucose 4,6-dehydratase